MLNQFKAIVIISAAVVSGSSTAQQALTVDNPNPSDAEVAGEAEPVLSEVQTPKAVSKLIFTYKVRENLDVQVTFENETAYDAVQLGLSSLNKCQENRHVPGVEEEAFFPEFFAMVNIDTSDGLLYISEKEAVSFASVMFSEYQKKVLPPEQVKRLSRRPVVDQYIVPGDEPL